MRESRVRLILIGYQLFFLISAVIFGFFGGYMQYLYEKYYHLMSYTFVVIAIISIFVCVLTAFVWLFGCCGAINSNVCLTITFSALLGLILLCQLCLGIGGFFVRSDMHAVNSRNFIDSLRMYKAQVGMAERWDEIQVKWDCCGSEKYKDWEQVFHNNSLPISCCRTNGTAGNVSCTQLSHDLRRQGCLKYFGGHLEDLVTVTASVGIFFAAMQVFGIGISCYAAKIFKRFNVYR